MHWAAIKCRLHPLGADVLGTELQYHDKTKRIVSRFYTLTDIEDNELEVYAIETDSTDSYSTEDRSKGRNVR